MYIDYIRQHHILFRRAFRAFSSLQLDWHIATKYLAKNDIKQDFFVLIITIIPTTLPQGPTRFIAS
jgi:hypothetical protein